MPGKRGTPEQRFMAKVEKRDDGCWIWTGTKNQHGYGRFGLDRVRRSLYAHRWAYERWVGPIQPGLSLDHLCRVPACVNPSHLEPVTQRENLLRGQTIPAANALKTHCPKGHEYAGDNLYISKRGQRSCRECGRASSRAAYVPHPRVAS